MSEITEIMALRARIAKYKSLLRTKVLEASKENKVTEKTLINYSIVADETLDGVIEIIDDHITKLSEKDG